MERPARLGGAQPEQEIADHAVLQGQCLLPFIPYRPPEDACRARDPAFEEAGQESCLPSGLEWQWVSATSPPGFPERVREDDPDGRVLLERAEDHFQESRK